MNVSKVPPSNFSLPTLSENVIKNLLANTIVQVALAAIALVAACFLLYRYAWNSGTTSPKSNVNQNGDLDDPIDNPSGEPISDRPRPGDDIDPLDKKKLDEEGSSKGQEVIIKRKGGTKDETIDEGVFINYFLHDTNGRRTYSKKGLVSEGKFESGKLQDGQLTVYQKAVDKQAFLKQKFLPADRTEEELHSWGRVTTYVGSGKFIDVCLNLGQQKSSTKPYQGEIITKSGKFDKGELSSGAVTKKRGQFTGAELQSGTVIEEEDCDFSADSQGVQRGRVLWNGKRKTFTKNFDDLVLEKEETFSEGKAILTKDYTDGKLAAKTKINIIKGKCVNGKLHGNGTQERWVTTFTTTGKKKKLYEEQGSFENGELKDQGTIEEKNIKTKETEIIFDGFFKNSKLNGDGIIKDLLTKEEWVGEFSKGALKDGYRLFFVDGQQKAEEGTFDEEGHLEVGIIGPADIITTKVLEGKGMRISLATDPKNPKIHIRKIEDGTFKADKLTVGSVYYKKSEEGSQRAFWQDDKEERGTFADGKLDGNDCTRKVYRSNTEFTEFFGKFNAGSFEGVGRVADKRRAAKEEKKVAIESGSQEAQNAEEKDEEFIRIIADFKDGKPCGKLYKAEIIVDGQSSGIALQGSIFLGKTSGSKSLSYDKEGLLTGDIQIEFGGPDNSKYFFIGKLKSGLPHGDTKVYKGSDKPSNLIYSGPFIGGEPASTEEKQAEIHQNAKLIFKGTFLNRKPSKGAFRINMKESKYFVGPIIDDCPQGEGNIEDEAAVKETFISTLSKAFVNSDEKVNIINKKSKDNKYEIKTNIDEYNDFIKAYDPILRKFRQIEMFVKRVKGYIANHR